MLCTQCCLIWLLLFLGLTFGDSEPKFPQYFNDTPIPRIIGGRPAKLGEIPYIISFKMSTRQGRRQTVWVGFCGGSLVAPRKIISAAHCFERKQDTIQKMCNSKPKVKSLSNIFAVAGNLRTKARAPAVFNNSSVHGQWRRLWNATLPHTYNFPKHDIAIIFVRSAFFYNDNVKPIPYATMANDYTGPCIGSGYGRINRKIVSDSLMTASLTPLTQKQCNRAFRKQMRAFVCTRHHPTDTERGDSGGPIVCFKTGDPNENNLGLLVGVVCGGSGKRPSINSRVSYYRGYLARNSGEKLGQTIFCIVLLGYACILSIKIASAYYSESKSKCFAHLLV